MKKPLIHIIGNHVTRGFVADGVHAYGGSPIMSEWKDEFQSIHQHAKALVISLGMLDPQKMDVIQHALKSANQQGLLVGIDPVGVHLSEKRFEFFKQLSQEFKIHYIRGNYEELLCLSNLPLVNKTLSLESNTWDFPTDQMVKTLTTDQLSIATGATDHLFYQKRHEAITGGSPKLREISGAGCLLSPLIAVRSIYQNDLWLGAIEACKDLKQSAQVQSTLGLGDFKIALLNELEQRRGSYA